MIGTTSDPVEGTWSSTLTVPEEPVYTPSPGYSAITTPVSPARITSGICSVAVEIEPLAVSAALPSANWSSINVTVPVGATVPPPALPGPSHSDQTIQEGQPVLDRSPQQAIQRPDPPGPRQLTL